VQRVDCARDERTLRDSHYRSPQDVRVLRTAAVGVPGRRSADAFDARRERECLEPPSQ
jgi:hypothetical protein